MVGCLTSDDRNISHKVLRITSSDKANPSEHCRVHCVMRSRAKFYLLSIIINYHSTRFTNTNESLYTVQITRTACCRVLKYTSMYTEYMQSTLSSRWVLLDRIRSVSYLIMIITPTFTLLIRGNFFEVF